ncbi:hypothetical protein CW734_10185 [Planococcus sp. MB-3u-03]|uniref:hypothetical protein n=1 Tax=Planococcus sp. MB-3u-03 TaxID=2058136 RepID=UPI000C339FFE|nr:hypothetical protein [Planococcus sp. MB-3u-03]AUD13933.1 hypothetical protein CW734_10185 [Planococcus sp. MB-3u-03]
MAQHIRHLFRAIDPFPPFVISLGVAAAILASRIFIGPHHAHIIARTELLVFSTLLPEADIPMMIASWAILFRSYRFIFVDGCCAVPKQNIKVFD